MSTVHEFPAPDRFPTDAARQEYANATIAREQTRCACLCDNCRERTDAARERLDRAWQFYKEAV